MAGFMMDPVEGYGHDSKYMHVHEQGRVPIIVTTDPTGPTTIPKHRFQQARRFRRNGGFMMDPVEGYGRLPYYSGDEGVTGIGVDASDMEADLQQALVVAEDAAMTAGAEVSALVQESRSHAAHRKFLYMVGAPVIVYAGLTNKSNKTLGLLSALVGVYVGVKNYQDEQDANAQVNNLGAYGVPGLPVISPDTGARQGHTHPHFHPHKGHRGLLPRY